MRKINNRHDGSIILVVMIIMTFLAGCMIMTLLATSKLCAFAQARYVYQQQRTLLEGLLEVGIAYCCDNRVDLFKPEKQSRTIRMIFDPWPAQELIDKIGHYQGSVVLQTMEKSVKVDVQLSDTKTERHGSCIVTLWDEKKTVGTDTKLHVQNWAIDA